MIEEERYNIILKKLGRKLASLRNKADIKQRKMNISQDILSAIENGKRNFTIISLLKILDCFDVPLTKLLKEVFDIK